MKKIPMNQLKTFSLFSTLCFLLFTSMNCKKSNVTPIDQLPAATQTGANTFGCLVNGQVFLPKGLNFGGPRLNASYIYSNTNTLRGYFFNVSAIKNNGDKGAEGVSISSDSLAIKQGQKYVLKNSSNKGEIYGSYGTSVNVISDDFNTQGNYQGEVYFSRFDEIKGIVSGTFWFDAVNSKGEKVEVREGRFDVYL